MLRLELKRIFSKRIHVFAVGLALILAVIFSGFAVTSNPYIDGNGNLTNVEASARVPLVYQIGGHVVRQIPLVMVVYTIVALALIPFIYRSFYEYGRNKRF